MCWIFHLFQTVTSQIQLHFISIKLSAWDLKTYHVSQMCALTGLFITSPWISEQKGSWGVQDRESLLRNVVGFLTGGARSSVSFPHHLQAQRWWRVRGKSRFRCHFRGWWGTRWCVTCPPDSWPLCPKCPVRQGRKPDGPFALDWSAGLNWSAESYLAARWSSSLIVPAFSSTPTSLLS